MVPQALAVNPQRQVAALDDEQAFALRGQRAVCERAAGAGDVGITRLGRESAREFALGVPGSRGGGYGDGE